MSSLSKCPVCKATPVEAINLKCQHHPCYGCIKTYVSIESQSKLQTKYKINCPACCKKTVFYDIRHLILTKNRHEDEQIFVTDQYLTQKPEIKVPDFSQKVQNSCLNNQISNHSISRRGSIHSIANNSKIPVQFKCEQHSEPLKYFCNDCGEGKGKRCLLCAQCAKPHYNGGHKLLVLRQSQSKLLNLNKRNKEAIKSKNYQITTIIDNLTENKTALNEYYYGLQQNLNSEFRKIYNALQNKHNELRNDLKNRFEENLVEINTKIDKLKSQLNILSSLEEIQLKDFQTSLKFYQTYQKFVNSNPMKLNTIKGHFQELKLPKIQLNYEKIQTIAKDLFEIVGFSSESSKKKGSKLSNYDEKCGYLSQREKQTRKLQISYEDSRLNTRKLVT